MWRNNFNSLNVFSVTFVSEYLPQHNPLKIEYEIVLKRQRPTKDMDIEKKWTLNISFHRSFNRFVLFYLLLLIYTDSTRANWLNNNGLPDIVFENSFFFFYMLSYITFFYCDLNLLALFEVFAANELLMKKLHTWMSTRKRRISRQNGGKIKIKKFKNTHFLS